MCDGYPCIASCGPGALTFLDRRLRTIGLAEIAPSCLAHLGQECHACEEACRDARAIRPDAEGRPVVSADRCTGCALCVGKCPADPPAIAVRPR
jgi:Pyruvate/2-oxoacid:ferredoxin oxidoreductase delta subunit